MAIDVQTKDCAVLGDADFAEMADLAGPTVGWEVGMISKQAEEWVLASQAFERDKLRGFMLATLERIGGTPALVIGLASIARTRQRSTVLRALMEESYHKALMAFPDEDVLVATRLVTPGPLEALEDLHGVRPWPETRANGEERAWGRRLSKRYGAVAFDDRAMVARGDGDRLAFDHEALTIRPGAAVLDGCNVDGGEYVIAWGWAMAEHLERFA
ncbi:MAG: hypothetical protein ACFCVK_10715 [Acidimicrobiales bacterium]